MKRHIFFLSALFSLNVVFAQTGAPNAIKYQAVVRDIKGDVVVNKNIQMTVHILQEGYGEVYREQHDNLLSNAFGLVNFNIGEGTTMLGRFDTIRWGEGPYYVELEIAIDGTGSSYLTEDPIRLLSVPFAFYANYAGNGGGGSDVDLSHLTDRMVPFYDSVSKKLQDSKIRQSLNMDTVAIESHASVSGNLSVGTVASISDRSIELGPDAKATALNSFAIGRGSYVGVGTTGDPLSSDTHPLFAIGMNNSIESNHYSFIVGSDDTVKEALYASIIGNHNKITQSKDFDMFSHVVGDKNTITNSERFSIFGYNNSATLESANGLILGEENIVRASRDAGVIIGTENLIDASPNGLILGNRNRIQNSPDSKLNIMIGHANIANAQVDNMLIGQSNSPTGDNNIAIGSSNKPNRNSIFIGSDNDEYGGNSFQNIVLGYNNKMFSSGTNSGITRQSILIGNNIGYAATNDFPQSGTINIGNDIKPFIRSSSGGSGGSGVNNGNFSINIGNLINTFSQDGIAIGHNINTITGSNTISLGRNIENLGNCIILGQNYRTYPTALPRFVVGDNFIPTPNRNILVADNSGNLWLGPNSSDVMSSAQGTLYAKAAFLGTNSVAVTSDRRLKSRIKPVTKTLSDYLYAIRPYSFVYTNDEKQAVQWGFMAQDVAPYFPDLVSGSEDQSYALNYFGFIPILWKIAQEQQFKIDEQQSRIDDLESKLEQVEQQIEYLMQKLNP